MAVRVRLFAAVREAAGTSETTVAAGPLPAVLDELRGRYPPPFPARLAVCTVLVDGQPTPHDSPVDVRDGAEVVLLPPFSGGAAGGFEGGSADRPPGRSRRGGKGKAPRDAPGEAPGDAPRGPAGGAQPASAPAAIVLGLVIVGAVIAGRVPFATVVLLLAGILLVDLTGALARGGPRPVVLAAAIPGIGLPAAVVVRPDVAWGMLPDVVAGGLLAAFVAVLVFGRRREVAGALGATAIAGLVVGLGTSGLLLLSSLPDGTRWVLGVLVVVAAVESARRFAGARTSALASAVATVAVALAAAGALVVGVDPPFGLPSAAGVAAVALLAAPTAGLLREAVADAAASLGADEVSGARGGRGPGRAARAGAGAGGSRGAFAVGRPATGILAAAAMPLLLAAPAAYALARLAAL